MVSRMLVLGGTSFLGRAFVELATKQLPVSVSLFNRGVTNPALFPDLPRLIADRDDRESCRQALDGTHWNYVVDFSGYHHQHIHHVTSHCRWDHYTFVSSSAVDLSHPNDDYFAMAQGKLWCEHLLSGIAIDC